LPRLNRFDLNGIRERDIQDFPGLKNGKSGLSAGNENGRIARP